MPLPNDDSIVLLHNPRCSKSRATQALLEQRQVTFSVRLYLEDSLDVAELDDLGRRLGRRPHAWVRIGEDAYAAAGLSPDAPDATIFEAIEAQPVLMERPIVIRGKRAVVGRPPEDVLALLD